MQINLQSAEAELQRCVVFVNSFLSFIYILFITPNDNMNKICLGTVVRVTSNVWYFVNFHVRVDSIMHADKSRNRMVYITQYTPRIIFILPMYF